MLTLPADILFLICEELSRREDFNTLLNCALAGKSLARSALLWLYRIHHLSPIFDNEGKDVDLRNKTYDIRQAIRKRITSMRALQWKSIIRSSLGKTVYPYCLYIRSLDLQTLDDLLDDPLFRQAALDEFFADDMAKLLSAQETPMKQKVRGAKKAYRRLDVPNILELVGESITKFISDSARQHNAIVTVEELSGAIRAGALLTWTSRLSNLRSLTLYDGSALSESVGAAIATSCLHFDDLTYLYYLSPDADHGLASFFGALNRNTLRSFFALNAEAIGPETLSSLSHHAKSLKKLKLWGLRREAIRNLSSLQECTALETLELVDTDGLINRSNGERYIS